MFLTSSIRICNHYTFCNFFQFIREFARTIRRNPETVLTELVPKWEQYAPYIITYARGLPGCISMVEVFDDQDNNTGMTLTREPTFYILYKRKNEGIFKSSGEVPKKMENCLSFLTGLGKRPSQSHYSPRSAKGILVKLMFCCCFFRFLTA